MGGEASWEDGARVNQLGMAKELGQSGVEGDVVKPLRREVERPAQCGVGGSTGGGSVCKKLIRGLKKR